MVSRWVDALVSALFFLNFSAIIDSTNFFDYDYYVGKFHQD